MISYTVTRLIRRCLYLVVLSPTAVLGFSREYCNKDVSTRLRANESFPVNYFFGENGRDPDNPLLTRLGCEALCGPQSYYPDIGPRMVSWLLPVFLLVWNIDVSPLDKWRYLEIFHVLGDPIDTLWSLQSKIEAWASCQRLAKRILTTSTRSRSFRGGSIFRIESSQSQDPPTHGPDPVPDPANSTSFTTAFTRDLGTVLAGMEEILKPHYNPWEELRLFLWPNVDSTQNQEPVLAISESQTKVIQATAIRLADIRADAILRTAFSVALYVLQVLAAFITNFGGEYSSPPAGRIGTAMFLTFLVPIALLSNTIGSFATRRSCFHVIYDMVEALNQVSGSQPAHSPLVNTLRHPDDYFKNQRWFGGSYLFRPDKYPSFITASDKQKRSMLMLSVAPIMISFGTATGILYLSPPNGFNCRGLMIVIMTAAYLLSPCLTALIWHSNKFAAKKKLWYIILAKDILIGVPIIVMIFLSSAGQFNSCSCWSASYTRGKDAYIPLNTLAEFQWKDDYVFPWFVAVCLLLQGFSFGGMLYVGRRGLRLMRWSEQDRQRKYSPAGPTRALGRRLSNVLGI